MLISIKLGVAKLNFDFLIKSNIDKKMLRIMCITICNHNLFVKPSPKKLQDRPQNSLPDTRLNNYNNDVEVTVHMILHKLYGLFIFLTDTKSYPSCKTGLYAYMNINSHTWTRTCHTLLVNVIMLMLSLKYSESYILWQTCYKPGI